MQRLEVSTVVHLPPQPVYEFLVDFPRYARYSSYLDRVEQHGDGGPGTTYDLVFSWWVLSYTARSTVTGLDAPRQIDWRTVKDIDARGHWRVEPEPTEGEGSDDPREGENRNEPTEGEPAADGSGEPGRSRVYFVVEYDRSSADSDAVDLPRFVSFDTVLDRVTDRLKAEATTVVERVVAELEGEPREVELCIHETPSV